MTCIEGTIAQGQIVPDSPVEWPDGMRVRIEPVEEGAAYGMREEDWPTTPEGIEALLARMDKMEPLILTPDEEAQWEAIRKVEKEREKARFIEDAEKLRRLWE
jgi:hypothetical protein